MNEEALVEKLRKPTALQQGAADAIEALLAERERSAQELEKAEQARQALERYRDGLKHSEHDYEELREAMMLLGSPVDKWRIRPRKTKSRAELILRIDGLMDNLDSVHGMVSKLANDPNATPSSITNARGVMRVIEQAQEEARSDIETCGAAITSVPAGQKDAVTDHCILEEGHDGNHRGKAIEWPQETIAATA